MRDYQNEMLKAVDEINEELSEIFDVGSQGWIQSPEFVLCLSFYESVEFYYNTEDFVATIKIYNSENDDRIYYDETDSYETWTVYLRRKLEVIKNTFSSIKLNNLKT